MNIFVIIYAVLIGFQTINSQIVQYANRFRNVSIDSETGNAFLVSSKIYQDKKDHKMAVVVNITNDIRVKNIEVVLNRCSFEKSDCENFQKWKFTSNLKSIIYMKNQMWTPIFAHLTPELDLPKIKKNIYRTPDANLDTKAIVMFYPESVNYFWRIECTLNDSKDKKTLVLNFEFSIFTYVERKRIKAGQSTKTTKS